MGNRNIGHIDETDATRGTNVGKACTRLNFGVYQNGESLKQINQQSSEAGFGTFNLSLKPEEFNSRQTINFGHHCCHGRQTGELRCLHVPRRWKTRACPLKVTTHDKSNNVTVNENISNVPI